MFFFVHEELEGSSCENLITLFPCTLIILSVKPLTNIMFKLQTEEATGLPIFEEKEKTAFSF